MAMREIEFEVDGTICRGELHLPDAATPAPIIVLAHGIGGVQEMRLTAYARRFADAGYAALTFDYRRFGRSDGQPRGILSIRDEQTDIRAALAFARGLDGEVDTDRVVLFGTSFAGGHAAQIAAADHDLAAVIVQAPFTSGIASALALHPASAIGSGAIAFADLFWSTLLRRGPVFVPLVGTRWTPALMTAPDVVVSILGQLPEGSRMSRRLSRLYRIFAKRRIALPPSLSLSAEREHYCETRLLGELITPEGTVIPNGIAARIALRIPTWNPGKAWRTVTAPVSFTICTDDSVAPAATSLKIARRCPTAEIHEHPVGHFDIYTGDLFEKTTAEQIDFLNRHVPLGAASR